jgi:hypothetical protein
MWTLLPLLAALAGPAPVPPSPLAGGLAATVEDATGLDVDRLLREWHGELRGPGRDLLAPARPGSAPAGLFDRGPELPRREMVVLVPVLSF